MKIQEQVAEELQRLREAWPKELGPFLSAPFSIVADWYEEHGNEELARLYRELDENSGNMTIRWRV